MRWLVAAAAFVGLTVPGFVPTSAERLTAVRPPVVWIPGGWFVRGSGVSDVRQALVLCLFRRDAVFPGGCTEEDFADERPARRSWVSSFGLDRTEVSQREWRHCVHAGACPPPRLSEADPRVSDPRHPVAGVTWDEAGAYCRWRRGRLPTEAEWERAARGSSARQFPWGDAYNERLANHGRAGDRPDGVDGYRHAAPVDGFVDGASPYGVLQMAGNVWEWTADHYQPDAYGKDVRVDPRGPPEGVGRVVRGGSWRSPPHMMRAAHRDHRLPEQAWADVGVRCAYDAPPPAR
jgi:formylglycine-generating enzyme